MAELVPLKAVYDGSSICGLSELRDGDVVGVEHGGLGVCTIPSNTLLIGNGQGAISTTSALTTNGQIIIGGTGGPQIANLTGTSNEVEITDGNGAITIGLPATVQISTNLKTPAFSITNEYCLPTSDGSAGQIMCTDGSGALAFVDFDGTGHCIAFSGTTVADRTCLNFLGGGVTVSDNSGTNATDITIPVTTPELKVRNTSGVELSIELDNTAIGGELICDTTPQLGGTLDVNGYAISSVTNCNISISPNGTGSVVLDGLSWPQADGTAGYILCTNGSGTLAWAADASGGSAAGSNNEIQYNNSGSFGASSNLTFDGTNLAIGANTAPANWTLTPRLNIEGVSPGIHLKDTTGSAKSFVINANADHLYFANDTDNDASFQMSESGNVGINTTPLFPLHVRTASDFNLGVQNAASSVYVNAANNANNALVPMTIAANPLMISGGNVGIGTIAPCVALDVHGCVRATTGYLVGWNPFNPKRICDNGDRCLFFTNDMCYNCALWGHNMRWSIAHCGSERWNMYTSGTSCCYRHWGVQISNGGGLNGSFTVANSPTCSTCTVVRSTCILCAGVDIVAPTKSFLINHPCCDADTPNKFNSMLLKHVTSEGPEYNVFYRGSATLCNGVAIVELPEYFESLTHDDDRTVQLTTVGGWSPLTVKTHVEDGQFEVCTTAEGDLAQEFDWRVDARRFDGWVREEALDQGIVNDDGDLIDEYWKPEHVINATPEEPDNLDVLDEDDIKQMLNHQDIDVDDTDTKEDLLVKLREPWESRIERGAVRAGDEDPPEHRTAKAINVDKSKPNPGKKKNRRQKDI